MAQYLTVSSYLGTRASGIEMWSPRELERHPPLGLRGFVPRSWNVTNISQCCESTFEGRGIYGPAQVAQEILLYMSNASVLT